MIFALYGSWEAGDSLKIVSRGVGTFSTIEDVILRTSIFQHFFGPRSLTPKARPTLHKAGRTSSKSGSFGSKSRPDHPRRIQKLASQRKARPASHKPKSSKSQEYGHKSWCKAGRTHPFPFKIIPGAIGSKFGIEFHQVI